MHGLSSESLPGLPEHLFCMWLLEGDFETVLKHQHGMIWKHKVERKRNDFFGAEMAKVNKVLMLLKG